MGGTTTRRRLAAGGAGGMLTAAVAVAGLFGAVSLVGLSSPYGGFLLLTALTLSGLAVLFWQVRGARKAAAKVSSDLDAVATHLVKLEHRLAQARSGADPALRSEVAEVSGEIGLLGGLLRDLAEAVAAQDRDVADLKERLTPRPRPESRSERSVLVARGEPAAPAPAAPEHPEPSLLPASRRDPAAAEAEARRLAAILEAFEADRLELHLQPVVSLPQRKVKLYEALGRLRLADETVLVPAEFLPHLERLGHAAELDRRILGRAVSVARHLVARASEAVVAVNLSPGSFDDPAFLRSLARLLDVAPDTVGRIVLEVSQRCWRTLDMERAGLLAVLRDRGVPFSLDRATDLRIDPLTLAERGVRYVKLPADLLLSVHSVQGNPALDIAVADLASVLERAGIRLIAEKVEREDTVPDLIDLEIPLAQGFVFAAPRAVRTDVLQSPGAEPAAPAAERPPEPAPPPAPPESPAGERRSFRDFLRRAT